MNPDIQQDRDGRGLVQRLVVDIFITITRMVILTKALNLTIGLTTNVPRTTKPFSAFGVDFAPLHVPVERRIQVFAFWVSDSDVLSFAP